MNEISVSLTQLMFIVHSLPNVDVWLSQQKDTFTVAIPDYVTGNKTIGAPTAEIGVAYTNTREIRFRINRQNAYPEWQPETTIRIISITNK